MVSKLRSWWRKTSKPRLVLIVTLLVILLVLLIGGYFFNWTWTGFGLYTLPNSNFQREKTLYDWLQLAIIPIAIAFGVLWLNRLQQQRDQQLADQRTQIEREAAEKRDQTERDIALDNQREAALQSYLDSMSALLLDNKMISGTPHLYKVPTIARVRTLTLLPRLDGRRKASVLQFLYESGLIEKGKRIVDLSGADLNGADLLGAQLSGADLSGASLREANLFLANLSEADLRSAVLTAANLFQANLSGANLEKAFLDGGADLRFATLNGANLQEAKLKGTNLQGTDATSNQLDKAIFYESVNMPDGTEHA